MKSDESLVVLKSLIPDAGFGLFVKKPFEKGSIICEYTGILLRTKEALRIKDKSYLMRLGPQAYVDARETLEVYARYINDCGNKFLYNVEFDKKPDLGKAYVIAKRDIQPGEELFVNYGKWYWLGKKEKKRTLVKVKLPPEPI
eukprot:g327.t1